MDDVSTAVGIINRDALANGGVADVTVEEYAADLEKPGFSLEDETRVLVDEVGRVVGVGEFHNRPPWVRGFGWVRTDPDFTGRGIADWLLSWVEDRGRERLFEAPADARVMIGISAASQNLRFPPLAARHGFAYARTFCSMQIALEKEPPAPAWPDGLQVRSAAPDVDDFAVYVAVDEAFEDHWGHVSVAPEVGFPQWQHSFRNSPGFDPELNFMVMDGDEIAAVAICQMSEGDDASKGFISQLGVRRPWRKRGVGRALLQHVFRAFFERGARSVGLMVDAASLTGATRLYESVGMSVAYASATWEKELRAGVHLALEEIAA